MYSQILMLFTFVLAVLNSTAQCDQRLKPADNVSIAYTERSNRCEGYYKAQVGAPSIQVVGLVKGKFAYNYSDKNEIINVYSTLNDRTINIRAVGVPLNTYYQMDAYIEPSGEFKWPVKDVIYPNQLRSRSIMIFGWTGAENNKTYVPVITVPAINTITNDDITRLYIRTSTEVSQVIWRSSTYNGGICGQYGEYNKIEGNYKAGKSIPINLSNISGQLCIEIKAKKANSSDWIRKEIQVLIDEE